MTHTPEPWKEWHGDIIADGDKASDFDDYVIAGIGRSYGSRSSDYSAVRAHTPAGKANARRIVACVNALSGISTETIEAGLIAELIRASGDLYVRAVVGTDAERHAALDAVGAVLAKLEQAS